MPLYETLHCEYDYEDEHLAWVTYKFIHLLCKFDIVRTIDLREGYVGDITLTIEYAADRTNQ